MYHLADVIQIFTAFVYFFVLLLVLFLISHIVITLMYIVLVDVDEWPNKMTNNENQWNSYSPTRLAYL